MPITALYASLLAPLFVYLAVRVIGLRRVARVALGDGGNTDLLRAVRVHGNFAEYVPFALLILALAESVNTDARLIHGLGVSLLLGRLVHAFGLSQRKENFRLRVAGVVLTFSVIVIGAAACLFGAIKSLF